MMRLLSIVVLLAAARCALASDRADVVFIAFEPAVARSLEGQLDSRDSASPEDGASASARWTAGLIKSDRYARPYRVVIGLSGASGQAAARRAVEAALERWSPRFIVRAGSARSLDGSLAPRDIVISRLVWRYEYTRAGFIYRHEASYRSGGTMITAAASVAEAGIARRGWGQLKAGTVASGNVFDAADRALVSAILSNNPRTVVADSESAAIAETVIAARERAVVVGYSVLFGVKGRGNSGAEAVGAFAGALLRTRWPAAPR